MSDGPFAGHERAEAAPRESEQRFRTVIDLVPELLWQSERDGSALWFNGRWFAYTGQTPAEAAGFGWLDAVHPEDRAAARASYLAALEAGRSLQREDRIRSVTGEYRWFLVRAEPVRDERGRVTQWHGAAIDAHDQRLALEAALQATAEADAARRHVERRAAERTSELARTNVALYREVEERARTEQDRNALRRQLASAEEDERRRLARELHDQVGQYLTALGLGLQALSDVAVPGSEVDRRTLDLRRLADDMGRELHAVAVRLRPRALDDFGLETALASLALDWKGRTGIDVEVHARLDVTRLPNPVETAVYRVVQEALTNIARHSGATRASVLVERRDGDVVAIVEDDGKGIDPDAIARSSAAGRLGLLGIRERAAILGGSAELESAPGQGTTVFVRLPIDDPAPAPPAVLLLTTHDRPEDPYGG